MIFFFLNVFIPEVIEAASDVDAREKVSSWRSAECLVGADGGEFVEGLEEGQRQELDEELGEAVHCGRGLRPVEPRRRTDQVPEFLNDLVG